MKLFDVYSLFDLNPAHAKGSYVWDDKGQQYLDFYGGHAVISIGHSHPHFIKSINEQLEKLAFYSNSVINPLQVKLADLLGQLSGLDHYQLFLCNSGAEAMENALKLASFQNERTKIIAFKKGFHGRTSAAVNITDSQKITAPINARFPVVHHDLNNTAAVLKDIQQGDVAAVVVEGIQGIGGIHLPEAAFLEQIATACKKYNTLLILDEIQSGYGRSGHFFAFQHAKIQPDIITMAKGMGNGFPIGGILIHPEIPSFKGQLGSTFGGNHLACAAGLAVLEVIQEENLISNAQLLGNQLKKALQQLPLAVEVRGKGLMIGLEFSFPVKELRQKLLYDFKVFTGSSSDPNVLRLLPPLNITTAEVQQFLDKLEACLIQTQQLQLQ